MQNNSKSVDWRTIFALIGVCFIFNLLLAGVIYFILGLWLVIWRKFKSARFGLMVVTAVAAGLGWVELNDTMSQYDGFRTWFMHQVVTFLSTHMELKTKNSARLANIYYYGLSLSFILPLVMLIRTNTKFKSLISRELSFDKLSLSAILSRWKERQSGVLIGTNNNGEEVILSDYERGMHAQVIGSTGFGKTVSVVMPLIASDLERGKPIIFIDGKGDLQALQDFTSLVMEKGREDDVFIFAPLFPNISNAWNPLATGDPLIRKDRLVGAQIWSEEFYKKKGEDLLISVFTIFDDLQITPTFNLLALFLSHPDAEFINVKSFRSSRVKVQYEALKKTLKTEQKSYSGIVSDINLFCSSYLAGLFSPERGAGINLFNAIRDRKIVYFLLPVLMMEETMKRIGRMIIHDLKTVCSEIQTFIPEEERMPASIIIDEFASFASESFTELLNKARSSKMGITLIHQSLGDLESVSKEFASQIFENTNIKIILRVDDPDTIERYCSMAGTHTEEKLTRQVDLDIMGSRPSGAASSREVEAFNVNPNLMRNLMPGQAVVMVKNSRKIHITKLNYLKIPKVSLKMVAQEAHKIVIPKEVVNELQTEHVRNPEKQTVKNIKVTKPASSISPVSEMAIVQTPILDEEMCFPSG